jgi:hypothetical protein
MARDLVGRARGEVQAELAMSPVSGDRLHALETWMPF